MKKIASAVILLLLAPAAALAGPVMVIDQPRLELSEPVMEGTDVTGRFTVRNAGDAPLTIEKASPG